MGRRFLKSFEAEFLIRAWGKRGLGTRVIEGGDNILEAGNNSICRQAWGHCDFGGNPSDSITDACSSGFPDPGAVATIRVHGWSDVPGVEAMG